MACLFLACKTEDYPRSINDLIIALYNLQNTDYCRDLLEKKTWYKKRMDEITSSMNYHSPQGGNAAAASSPSNFTDESGLAASPASTRSMVSPMQKNIVMENNKKTALLPTPTKSSSLNTMREFEKNKDLRLISENNKT